jgi:hypothetical protein
MREKQKQKQGRVCRGRAISDEMKCMQTTKLKQCAYRPLPLSLSLSVSPNPVLCVIPSFAPFPAFLLLAQAPL